MTESEQPQEVVREAARGRSERTPALVHHGVLLIVAVAVAIVVAIAFLVYFLAA